MRLLKWDNPGKLSLTEDLLDDIPPYAILSHTWGADKDEVTFSDLENGSYASKAGYIKLQFCGEQARKNNIEHFWVDTCCINKASHVEFSEAITSMFRWYRDADKCYVYLSDVSARKRDNDGQTQWIWESAFRTSRWHTRGWTLQELLAPTSVEFFSREGELLGSKMTLTKLINVITGIPVKALQGQPLSTFSVDERKKWAEKRATKKIEDRAYCLVGMFDVSMDFRYGEGDKAFERLEAEIGITVHEIDDTIKKTYDDKRLMVERLSGRCLSLDDCYINLCIVEHNRDSDVSTNEDTSDKGHLLSKFSLNARLKVETPPESKQVSLNTLFDLRSRKDGTKFRPNRILIWGGAGMGKTTLCKKIVHDFYHKRLWGDFYDRLVWLPLRRLKLMGSEAHSTITLIQNEFFQNRQKKNLEDRLHKVVIQGERTLFILDGLDEVSYILDPDSSIGRVLGSLLRRPNVIITSRPHSTSILDHMPPDLSLETIGFFPQQIEEYIQRVTKKTNSSDKTVSDIQSFIRNRPLVQSLARIPIQLDAICYIWNTKRFPRDNVTMTTLYLAISQSLWEKDVVRLGKQWNGVPITEQQIKNSSNVEGFAEAETKFLQELAFQGLCKEIVEFETEDMKGVQRGRPMLGDRLVHMSFLRSSDNSVEVSDRTMHFIHLTFQEFFAAQYFVRYWLSGAKLGLWSGGSQGGLRAGPSELRTPEDFLKSEKYVGRYDIFWRFVVGLLQTEADHSHLHRFMSVLEEEPFDLVGLTHQRLTIHCLSEINSADTEFQPKVRKLEKHYLEWIMYESRLNESGSPTSLMWEAECSDYLLDNLLKKFQRKMEVMEMLLHRLNVSSDILDVVLHTLNGSTDLTTRKAAIQVLGSHCSQTQEKKVDFWHRLQVSTSTRKSEVVKALSLSRSLQQPAALALVALLRDADTSVRSDAASALGGQTSLPGSAIEALVALLRDVDASVRSDAASALGGQTSLPDSAIEALVALLRDVDASVRSDAASALGGQTSLPDSAIEALVALLRDVDASVRSHAASALGGQTSLPDSAIEALVALLRDADASVRSHAASALGGQTSLPGSAIEALVALLRDVDASVRSHAASALGGQTSLPGSAIEALVALLRDADASVRSDAAWALRGQTSLPGSAIEALVALLRDTDASVRFEAASALGGQTSLPGSAIEALVALLRDADASVRSHAASALRGQTSLPDSAIEALVALLRDADASVRSHAASALGGQTSLPGSAIEALVALLRDADASVRFEAASALGGQTSPPGSAIEALVALLRDVDASVRSDAASALGGQTSLPDSAIEALVALLRDVDASVRSHAAWALGGQTSLPGSAIEALVALLSDADADGGVRSDAAHLLDRLDGFLPLIPKLDSLALRSLLDVWLRRKSVTCFIWNGSFCINIHGKLRMIRLENGQQASFEDAWRKAQDTLGLTHLLCSREGDSH